MSSTLPLHGPYQEAGRRAAAQPDNLSRPVRMRCRMSQEGYFAPSEAIHTFRPSLYDHSRRKVCVCVCARVCVLVFPHLSASPLKKGTLVSFQKGLQCGHSLHGRLQLHTVAWKRAACKGRLGSEAIRLRRLFFLCRRSIPLFVWRARQRHCMMSVLRAAVQTRDDVLPFFLWPVARHGRPDKVACGGVQSVAV